LRRRPDRIAAAVLIAVCLLAACSTPEGIEVFVRENCIKCHTFNTIGQGTIDLTNVALTRSEGWIKDQIRDPGLHRSDTGMPSFAHLSGKETNALYEFLVDKRQPPR
jgi:cbb3-type cytochrome oxidase cytochrome c subunit